MRLIDTISCSFRSVVAFPVRSLLTASGIAIGMALTIFVVVIGCSARDFLDDSLGRVGKTLIVIYPKGLEPMTREDRQKLNADPVIRILTTGAGEAQTSMEEVRYESRSYITDIGGVSSDVFTIRRWRLACGRFFGEDAERARLPVAVLGATAAEALFPHVEAVGKTIRISGTSFRVIGRLQRRGRDPLGRDHDDVVFIPAATSCSLFNRRDINVIVLAATDTGAIAGATRRAQLLLPHARVTSVEDMAETGILVMAVMNWLTIALATISLVVGAVGVLTLQLAVVAQRTWETGLRLAVGATPVDVFMQLLAEAVWIVLIGGMMGLVIGYGLGLWATEWLGWPFAIEVKHLGLSLVGLVCTGILSGLYPAFRAGQLTIIESLRAD